jgi:HD-GYP domain-containing protein (c-di-GMP phosphodiesterase class II)
MYNNKLFEGPSIRGRVIDNIRICALADAYDAMTSDRSYRPAMSKEYAIAKLKKNAGTQFDPELVEVFIDKVLHGYRDGLTNHNKSGRRGIR